MERPLQSSHSLERRDQAKPNYIAISIHMSWQVYSEWRAIGAADLTDAHESIAAKDQRICSSPLERFPKRLTRGFPWGREHDSRCLLGGGQQAWRSRIRRICVGEWLGRSRAGPPSRKLRSNGAS